MRHVLSSWCRLHHGLVMPAETPGALHGSMSRVRPLETVAVASLVFGNQALLYVLRERGHMWGSRPGTWVVASSVADVAIVSVLALSGVLMEPLPWRVLVTAFAAATGFALILDQIKRPVLSMFRI
jgi:H+-transporting ATPase